MSLQPRNGRGSRPKPSAGPAPSNDHHRSKGLSAAAKYQNKPLVAQSSSLESVLLEHRGLLSLVALGLLFGALLYYGGKHFIRSTFRHVDFTNNGVQLGDPETTPEVLDRWLQYDLEGFPVRYFQPQFGYRIDFQQFAAVMIGGSLNGQDLDSKCFEAHLENVFFDCADGEIVALAKIGDSNLVGVTDLENSGTLTIRGEDFPYTARNLLVRSVEVRQLIVRTGASSYVILQLPTHSFSMEKVMDVFSKAN